MTSTARADGVDVLLTGATGYVGRHLLQHLLESGRRVAVIARPGAEGAEARVRKALAPLGLASAEGMHFVAGDLSMPQCGFDAAAVERLRQYRPRALIHCAGLTRFDAHLAADLIRANLLGTRHAFTLAEDLAIGEFHHVSTAFVAGNSTAEFGAADFDVGQGFRNPYEASKFEAERFLRERVLTGASGVNLRIYRPSIVVGGQAQGERQDAGTVYSFIKALRFLRECCLRDLRRGSGRFARLGARMVGERVHIPLRVALDPAARMNMVSVQRVARELVAGLGSVGAGCETRSLVGPDFTLRRLKDVLARAAGVDGVEIVGEEAFARAPRSAAEALFHRATREYQPYLKGEVRFAAREKSDEPLDLGQIARDYCAALDAAGAAHAGESPQLSALALGALRVETAQDYFARLTGGVVARRWLQRIPYVNARVRFRIHDDERVLDRVLHFAGGQVREAGDGRWDFSYELEHELFMRIVRGQTDLRKAFFAGWLRIEGDRESALKFGFLLGEYLRQLEEHVVDEVVGL